MEVARFSASRISDLLAQGNGKTRQSYIYDLCLKTFGIDERRETAEMRHGLVNQYPAYEILAKPFYDDAIWFDESILINEKCSASPDVLIGKWGTLDVKCPYHIDSYLDQINSVPKKYFYQVQMQMLASKVDVGYLLFYLTKPEIFGEDNWTEYPFPLERRYKLFEYKKDEMIHDEIMEAVEKFHPTKLDMIALLQSATLMEETEYFERQVNGYAYRPLKESSNILSLDSCVRVKDKFYYLKK